MQPRDARSHRDGRADDPADVGADGCTRTHRERRTGRPVLDRVRRAAHARPALRVQPERRRRSRLRAGRCIRRHRRRGRRGHRVRLPQPDQRRAHRDRGRDTHGAGRRDPPERRSTDEQAGSDLRHSARCRGLLPPCRRRGRGTGLPRTVLGRHRLDGTVRARRRGAARVGRAGEPATGVIGSPP